MAFPKAEIHFNRVVLAPDHTEVYCSIFRLDNGGIVDGQQQYVRTLFGTREYKRLDAGWDDTRIIAFFKQVLNDELAARSLVLADADKIVTLLMGT